METRDKIARELLGKIVHVEVDRPMGYLHGDIQYPVNYGYIPSILAGDGEEQDAYILGISEPVASFDGRVIAMIRRSDDCEDKAVVAPDGMLFHQGEIASAVHFQEQYFSTTIDSLLRKSCGILPWRTTGDGKEFLVVYEEFSRRWSLPKGHMEAGETELQTALRELEEETGLHTQPDPNIFVTVEYPISPISRKQVVFFPGQVTGTPRVRDGEIGNYRWIPEEALDDYLYPDMAEAARKLIAIL